MHCFIFAVGNICCMKDSDIVGMMKNSTSHFIIIINLPRAPQPNDRARDEG